MVGSICESSDYLGRKRSLSVEEKDFLAILSAGAYCSSMNGNYNTRRSAAEVMVNQNKFKLIRQRGSFQEIWQNELNLDA